VESCTAGVDRGAIAVERRRAAAHREASRGEEPMRRLWQLPAAVVEMTVGTTIVAIHAALAEREQRRKRHSAPPPIAQPPHDAPRPRA
jgi:hypothetical protein